MGYYCTVPQCTSLAGKTKNVKFHRFPRDKQMADKWNIILKRGKPYTKYSKVCSLHFTQGDYNVTTMGQWKTLSKDAVPSQNLPKLNPDGTVMVIRKSRTMKYRDGKKDDSDKVDKPWQSALVAHNAHSLIPNAPDTPMGAMEHDNSILAYRLQNLGSIANAISPQQPMSIIKPKKQDAIMQTDPVASEDGDTQPNNSYSEVSEKSYSSEMDQYQSYPKVVSPYPKEASTYPKDSSPYLKDTSPYPRDASPYPKDSSPYSKDASPYPKDSSPYPKDSSPYPKDSSPYSKDASPYPKDSSPYSKDATPYPKDSSPYSKDSSPYPKDSFHYPKDLFPRESTLYKEPYPREQNLNKEVYNKDAYQKDSFQKEAFNKNDSYQKDAHQKDAFEPKDYTKSADYIPQTNEEYNKEAEKYALERKAHNGYDLKEYQKQFENNYQRINDMYSYNREYYQNGYPDSVGVLKNQQHNLQILQEQHRLSENQNFFNENHIKQEIDISGDDDKYMYERSKEQLESTSLYADRRLHNPRYLDQIQQVKQEPDVPNGCDNVIQPQGSPYYPPNGANAGFYEPLSRPGPELLIAKQNALAAHTQLWQNTMKRPFFYSESTHYNTPQLLHRYEDIPRILQ